MKTWYYIGAVIFVLTAIIAISVRNDFSYNKQINTNEASRTKKDIISTQIDSTIQSIYTYDSVTLNHIQLLEKKIDITLRRLQKIEYNTLK